MKGAPGRWLYGVAVLIFVAGAGGTLFFFVSRIMKIDDQLMTAMVPGRTELHLQKTGSYTIFHERTSQTPVYPQGLKLRLRKKGSTGDVPLSPVTGRYTYSVEDRAGVGVLEFSIAEPGTYELEGTYDGPGPSATLTVGHGFMTYILVTILGSLILGFASAGIAIAIAAVTFVKRYKASRPPPL
jgi:hypothetical protein